MIPGSSSRSPTRLKDALKLRTLGVSGRSNISPALSNHVRSMHPWLAQRTAQFDSSGIRKVFDLAARMNDPINLSIGQPDFPVPCLLYTSDAADE